MSLSRKGGRWFIGSKLFSHRNSKNILRIECCDRVSPTCSTLLYKRIIHKPSFHKISFKYFPFLELYDYFLCIQCCGERILSFFPCRVIPGRLFIFITKFHWNLYKWEFFIDLANSMTETPSFHKQHAFIIVQCVSKNNITLPNISSSQK